MALSPPVANSLTSAVTVPVPASTRTEYCLSAASCGMDAGSTRIPAPGVKLTDWVKASVPPWKLYQLRVAVVAVTLWRRIGVVHPAVPPRNFVRLGRKNFVAGVAVSPEPIGPEPTEGEARTTVTLAAVVPPVASILMGDFPSARQSVAASLPRNVVRAWSADREP